MNALLNTALVLRSFIWPVSGEFWWQDEPEQPAPGALLREGALLEDFQRFLPAPVVPKFSSAVAQGSQLRQLLVSLKQSPRSPHQTS